MSSQRLDNRGEMSGHGTAVVLLGAADETRRRVGPYAWVVLEHLASRTDPGAPDTAVGTSIRGIASHLAISKDTVTRALLGLIDAGLVERDVDRDAVTGRFGNATYRLHLQHAGLRVTPTANGMIERQSPEPSTSNPATGGRRTAPPNAVKRRLPSLRAAHGQLSLLDALDE